MADQITLHRQVIVPRDVSPSRATLLRIIPFFFRSIVTWTHKRFTFEEIYRACYTVCLLNGAFELHNLLFRFLRINHDFNVVFRHDPARAASVSKLLNDVTLHLNKKVCAARGWTPGEEMAERLSRGRR